MSLKRWDILLALFGVYVVWGSTYLAIAVAVSTLPPFLMASSRFIFSGAALYVWARRRGAERPTPVQWRSATIIGGGLLLGGNGLVVWAEQRVPSGVTALLISTVPIWMAFFESWRRRLQHQEKVRTPYLGLLLGFVGVTLLLGPAHWLGGAPIDPLGATAILLASCSWAAASLYARHAPLPKSVWLAGGMEMMAGGLLLALFGTLTGEWHSFQADVVSTSSWVALGYLALVGSLVGFSAYTYLLKETSVSVASTYAYVNPVIALLLGNLLHHEPFSLRSGLAAAVILTGVVLMVRRPASST